MIMSFAAPLGVGVTSEGEYFDLELKTPMPSKEAVERLNQVMVEGMDVVDKIAGVQTDFQDRPLQEQKMKKVTVDTMGVDYPEPEKA